MSRATEVLLKIMLDTEEFTGPRLEAAANLLSFEASEAEVAAAKTYLTSVFEGNESPAIRLEALKLMRKAESRRVVLSTVPAQGDIERRRQLWLRLRTARRRMKMIRAGLWPGPRGWADDLIEKAQQIPESELPSCLPVEDLATALNH